jgi:SOS-response transcriptional repressor LexA
MSDYVAMPLLSDKAAAGSPMAVKEDEIEDVVLLHKSVVKGGTYTAIRIDGDSMEPTIPHGAIVAVNHERRDAKLLAGKIILARHEDGVTVKWLQNLHGQLMLVPTNVAAHKVALLTDNDDIIGAVECLWIPLK